MTPKQEAWAIQAEHVIKQMERRHFNAYYCSTKEEALTKALSIIEKGSVIASGGSATLGEVGLLDYIKNHSEDYTFIDRSIAKTEDEKRQIHAKDVYKRQHDPRKHFSTMAKKYKVDEYALKYMIGHKIEDITEKVYTQRDVNWLKEERCV